MDITNYAVAAGLVTFFSIGGTELVKQAFARNWKAVVIILVSTAIGGLMGWALPVVGVVVGLALGLGASGLVTTVQKSGEGTNSLPTSNTQA
ncbi:MAG TPA: hypothetical protein VN081_04470 [Dongiaceae bacterium]|nr:hypothetical protein [Dongiaceae bacterium]